MRLLAVNYSYQAQSGRFPSVRKQRALTKKAHFQGKTDLLSCSMSFTEATAGQGAPKYLSLLV